MAARFREVTLEHERVDFRHLKNQRWTRGIGDASIWITILDLDGFSPGTPNGYEGHECLVYAWYMLAIG
jgi:hypothetical protein